MLRGQRRNTARPGLRYSASRPPDTPAGSAAHAGNFVADALSSSHWRAALEGINTFHPIALCQKPGTRDEIITFSSAAPQQVDYEIAIRLAVYAIHAASKPTIAGPRS
jgi:hypothetical protein